MATSTSRFKANPTWATDALARSWELMADAVQPAWYPRLDSVKATSSDQITGEVHEFGCGKYGCVYPTHDPNIVVKVTTDSTEAEFAAHLSQDLVRPVCVAYHTVISLDRRYKNRPVYLLWREAAYKVGRIDVVLGRQAENMVNVQHEAAKVAFKALNGVEVDIRGHPHEVMRIALGNWLSTCEAMARQTKVPELRALGDGMVEVYGQQRIFFGDVHSGNLGIVHRSDGGHWVITDPGHVAVVDLDL
jgi:hypothetical protein